MQLGGLGIFGPSGTAAQVGLRGEVGVTESVLPTVNAGLLRTLSGPVLVRDLQVGARVLAVRRDDLVLAVEPGLSLPVGSIGADAGPLPTTSGSVDPTAAADLIVGRRLLALAGVQARVPVMDGRDGLRQGPFVRGDLRAALRQGMAVPWLGASLLRQAPHDRGRGDLWEGAVVAGVSLELSDTTGVGALLRVPVWTDASAPYVVAPGVSVRQVLGRRRDSHEPPGPDRP